jgi:thymidylate synthase
MRRMRAAYEINFADEDDSFELPIYRVNEDADRVWPVQQPCLSHLSFKVYPGNALTLAAVYRSHYYVSKALGNLLGLAQLQSFVANETGLTVGPLICYSTHARIDTSPFKIADIKRVLSQCKTALSAPLPNMD